MNEDVIALLYFGGIIAIVVSLVIWYFINEENKQKVMDNSRNIRLLLKLNELYLFEEFYDNTRTFNCRVYSKRNFDKIDFEIVLDDNFEKDYDNFISDMECLVNNYNKYVQYESKYESLEEKTDLEKIKSTNLTEEKFYKIEKKLLKKNKIVNVCDYFIKIVIDYLSPMGRNYYKKEKIISGKEVIDLYNKYKKRIELGKSYEMHVRIERAKVNDSLRYDVFKRDNYRCCICGATAKENAKLHIDHIIPVSKGGKTTLNNLQTLCDRCNMGKSNKL